MADRVRIKTRRQGDVEMQATQDGFLGGMNMDVPASEIDGTECAELYNYIPYRTHLETRPGVIAMGDLPGGELPDLTVHQYEYNPLVGRHILHRGVKLWVGKVEVPSEGFPYGSMDWYDATTDMEVYDGNSTFGFIGKDTVVFTSENLYRMEWDRNLAGGYSVRLLTGAHPTDPVSEVLVPDGPTGGSYTYRFLYTLARIVDGEIIAESGTPSISGDDTDYLELTFPNEYGQDGSRVKVSASFVPVDPFWTHVICYRTLDITETTVSGNDPERYFECFQYELQTYSAIGTAVIGTTFIIAATETAPDTIITNAPLLKTRFMTPIEPGLLGACAPGLLFVAKLRDNIVRYSGIQDGSSKHAGLYNAALQYLELDDGVTGMEVTPDSMGIFCRGSTHRLTTYSTVNRGDEKYGEYLPVFEGNVVTRLDSTLGVEDWSSIARMQNGKVVAHCNDSTVRVFDGLQWSTDYSKRKVQRAIRTVNSDASAYYDSRGAYIMWYYDHDNVPRTLRLGMTEEGGIGWSWYDGANWPAPAISCRVATAPLVHGQRCGWVADDYGQLWVVEYQGVGNDRPVSDDGTDVEYSVKGREIRGTSERHWVVHQQTFVFLRPVPGYPQTDLLNVDLTVNAYTDGSLTPTATYTGAPMDERVVFSEDLGCRRLQIEVSATGAQHCIPNIETLFQSQDRNTLWDADKLRSVQEDLASDLVFWSNREDPLRNSAAWGGNEIGTWQDTEGSTVTGVDGKSDSALRLTN